MKIAVIGSNIMDIAVYTDRFPEAGETKAANDFHIACGGKGANQAVAAAKLGTEVLMVTAIGHDMFGEQTKKNFEDLHMDTRYVLEKENTSSGAATVWVDASSQNKILINKAANNLLCPADLEAAADELKKCAFIVLQLEVPLETVYAAIDFGCENHIPVLLNPAPALENLDMDRVCKCDFVVPNETELSILTGMPTESMEEIRKAAGVLLEHGLKNVIVTIGSRGSLWLSKEHMELVPALKVKAVDTTGAGDSFIGCFVAYYVESGDVLAAMKKASLYAALGVTQKGTQTSYATKEAFEKFAAEHE